ncbi:MAG TPA: hypothetical protein V6D15_02320 [Oculatellaceae cyanobacterium]
MTVVVQELLTIFNSLTDAERLEFASEILKRVMDLDLAPLSDEDLIFNAEGVFLELDKQESVYE